MKKKRFIKLMMALGYQYSEADTLARYVRAWGSYALLYEEVCADKRISVRFGVYGTDEWKYATQKILADLADLRGVFIGMDYAAGKDFSTLCPLTHEQHREIHRNQEILDKLVGVER